MLYYYLIYTNMQYKTNIPRHTIKENFKKFYIFDFNQTI